MNALALLTFCAVNLGTAGYTLDTQPPEGSVAKDPATSGSTEITSDGTFAATAADDEAKADDATELDASAGGFLSTGNAEAIAGTALIKFRLRRSKHQFRAEAAGNYGRATVKTEADPAMGIDESEVTEVTVGNVQGMMRYDWFFKPRWALFLQATGRHDRFQQLDFRMNVDPGVAFYALNEKSHRLWFEAGYDFQYDLRTDEAVNDPENPVDRVFTNHAARLFGGYVNNLNEHVTFDTGLEYLQSVVEAPIFRINWATALTANLSSRMTLSTTFQLRYENQPLPDIKQLDTITSVLLGVRLL